MVSSISVIDACVLWAKVRTSSATTENPLPCSPALAASMAALSASKLVCSAIPLMTSVTLLMATLSLVTLSTLTWLAFNCWLSLAKP